MLRNMVTSLIRHERIKTTRAKAREVRRKAEKIITRARVDSVHNRRMTARDIHDKAVVNRLFTEVAPRFTTRPGGYTRILKLGQRYGDAAEVVILELVDRGDGEKPVAKKRTRREKVATTVPPTEEDTAAEETVTGAAGAGEAASSEAPAAEAAVEEDAEGREE
jgi:large subunit ribosomal protein L17